MKRSRQLILNNRGSTLILTLIVFMTILILGMAMVSSMLYSQNENNQQIYRQKAYYAAQSAADAIKSYFLNPNSHFINTENIGSPEQLIGTTGIYTLKDQSLGEETVVSIAIKKEDTFIGNNKESILIEAVGTHQNQKSTVKVRLLQEKQTTSTSIYSDRVVFGGSYFTLNRTKDTALKVKGNILVNDSSLYPQITIDGIDLRGGDEAEKNTLYVEGKKTKVHIQKSYLQDVYVQFGSSGLDFNDNEAENAYIKYEDEKVNPWVHLRFDRNTISREAHLFTKNIVPGVAETQVGQKFIISLEVDKAQDNFISRIEANELYIKGAKELGAIAWDSTETIKVLYTDALVYKNLPSKNVNEIIQKDLTELNAYEDKVTTHLNNVKATSQLLRDKPSWNKEGLSSSFIKVAPPPNVYSYPFEEYYDELRGIRLVFVNGSGWYTVEKGTNENTSTTYYVSDEGEQVFFIAEQAQGVKFNLKDGEGLDAFYLYAPRSQCEFPTNFDYLKGSIIAEKIIIGNDVQAEFTFKEPKDIDGIGLPGGESSIVQSSYKYHFIEYAGS